MVKLIKIQTQASNSIYQEVQSVITYIHRVNHIDNRLIAK